LIHRFRLIFKQPIVTFSPQDPHTQQQEKFREKVRDLNVLAEGRQLSLLEMADKNLVLADKFF